MNLRDIKKDIEYVLSAFVEDCSVVVAVNSGVNQDKVAALMEEAVALYNDLRDKVVVKVDGPKKAYFAALRKEILEETDALYKKLSDVVKGEDGDEPAKKPAAEKKSPAKKTAEKKTEEKKPAAKKAPAKKPAAKKEAAE